MAKTLNRFCNVLFGDGAKFGWTRGENQPTIVVVAVSLLVVVSLYEYRARVPFCLAEPVDFGWVSA